MYLRSESTLGFGQKCLRLDAECAPSTRSVVCTLRDNSAGWAIHPSSGETSASASLDVAFQISALASHGTVLAVAGDGVVEAYMMHVTRSPSAQLTHTCAPSLAFVARVDCSTFRQLQFSPCGRFLCTLSSQGGLFVLHRTRGTGTDAPDSLGVIPLASPAHSSAVVSFAWSNPPRIAPSSLAAPSHRAAGVAAVQPLLLVCTCADGSLRTYRESHPWESLGFSCVPACSLPRDTAAPSPDVAPASVAWLRRVVAHDRLHWAWGDAAKGGAGAAPHATAPSVATTRGATRLSGSSGDFIAPPVLLPVPLGGSRMAEATPDVPAPASVEPSFPLPRNLIGKTSPDSDAATTPAAIDLARADAGAAADAPRGAEAHPDDVDSDGGAETPSWPHHGHSPAALLPVAGFNSAALPQLQPLASFARACAEGPPTALQPPLRPSGHVVIARAGQSRDNTAPAVNLTLVSLGMHASSVAASTTVSKEYLAPPSPVSALTIDIATAIFDGSTASAFALRDALGIPAQGLTGDSIAIDSCNILSAESFNRVRVGGRSPPSLPSAGTQSNGSDALASFRALSAVSAAQARGVSLRASLPHGIVGPGSPLAAAGIAEASFDTSAEFDFTAPSSPTPGGALDSPGASATRPRRRSLLSRLRHSRRFSSSHPSISDAGTGAAAHGASIYTRARSVSPSKGSAATAGKLRSRVASALATAAAFDVMDGSTHSHCGACDGGRSAPTEECVCHGPIDVLSRTAVRSGSRGSCVFSHASAAPATSDVTLQLCLRATGPSARAASAVADCRVQLTVDWVSHKASVVEVALINAPDVTAAGVASPTIVPQPAAAPEATASQLPTLPIYHPSFLETCLTMGRPHLAAAAVSHLAASVRRARLWQGALGSERERREELETAARLRVIEGHFAASPHARSPARPRVDSTAGFGGTPSSSSSNGSSPNGDLDIDLSAYAHADPAHHVDDAGAPLLVQVLPLPLATLLAPAPPHGTPVLASHGTQSASAATGAARTSTGDALSGLDGSDGSDTVLQRPAQVPLRLLRAWLAAHPYAPVTAIPPVETLLRCGPTHDSDSSAPLATPSYPPPLTPTELHWLIGELPTVVLPGLGPGQTLRLVAVLEALAALYDPASPTAPEAAALDAPGLRFLLAVKLFGVSRRCLRPEDRPAALNWTDVAHGSLSEHQDTLLRLCLPPPEAPLTWTDVRSLRLPVWVRSDAALRAVTERVARSLYVGSGKDPFAAMLPYLALGPSKLSLLRGLFRLSPPHQKVFSFLSNDFSDERWRKSASKNAFALIGQHRYEPAAGFFLLAGRAGQAIKTVTMQLHDPIVGLLIARLAAGNAATDPWHGAPVTASPPPRGTIGTMDAQSLIRDAARALLAATQAAKPAATGSGAVGSLAAPRSAAALGGGRSAPAAPQSRSILGFGFDDDYNSAPSSSSSSISRGAGGGSNAAGAADGGDDDDGSTYYAPLPRRAGGALLPPAPAPAPAAPPPSSPTPVPSPWPRIDVDEDPIGYVLHHELEAAALIACGGALPTLGAASGLAAFVPPIPPSDFALATVAGGASSSAASASGSAVELLALLGCGRQLEGILCFLRRVLHPQTPASGSGESVRPVAGSEAVRLAQLLTSLPPLRQPAVRKALIARLTQAGALPASSGSGLPPLGLMPSGTSGGSSSVGGDALDSALRQALARALLTEGMPSLAYALLLPSATHVGGAAASVSPGSSGAALKPVKKGSLFADFDAPPAAVPAVAPKRSGSLFADFDAPPASSSALIRGYENGNGFEVEPPHPGEAASAATVITSLISDVTGALVSSHVLPLIESLASADADWRAECGAANGREPLRGALTHASDVLRGELAALARSTGTTGEPQTLSASSFALDASRAESWLAAATARVADAASEGVQPVMIALLQASSAAFVAACAAEGTLDFCVDPGVSLSAAQHAVLAQHARLGAACARLLSALSDRASEPGVYALLPHIAFCGWLHLCVTAGLAHDWRRLHTLLAGGAVYGRETGSHDPFSAALASSDHVLFADEAAVSTAPPPSVPYSCVPGCATAGAASPDAWLTGYLGASLTVLVAMSLTQAAHQLGCDSGAGAGGGGNDELSRALSLWRDRAIARVRAGAPLPGLRWGPNTGLRREAITALTGLPSSGGTQPPAASLDATTSPTAAAAASSGTSWWADPALLASAAPGDSTAAIALPPPSGLPQLWAWLGGPGLLWTVSTEYRALARAVARACNGFLPDAPIAHKVDVRRRGHHPPVLDLCGLAPPSLSSDQSSNADGSPVSSSAVFTSPLLLASSPDIGVGHLDIKQQQQQLLQPGTPVAGGAAPYAHRNTIGHTGDSVDGRPQAPKRSLGSVLHDMTTTGAAARSAGALVPSSAPSSASASARVPTPVVLVHSWAEVGAALGGFFSGSGSSSGAATPPAGGQAPAAAPSPATSAASLQPTAPAAAASISPHDRHEYSLPFTLEPQALAAHPSQPVYAQAGPEGMLAVISVALKDDKATHPSPPRAFAAAAGDGLVQQASALSLAYAHSLQSVLSYTPLPGVRAAHALPVHHPYGASDPASRGSGAPAHVHNVSSAAGGAGAGAGGGSSSGGAPSNAAAAAAARRGSGAFGIAGLVKSAVAGLAHSASGTALASLIGGAPSPAGAAPSGGPPGFGSARPGIARPSLASVLGDMASSPIASGGDRGQGGSGGGGRSGGHHTSATGGGGVRRLVDTSINLDEQVTRLRWTPDGSGVAAAFASGVVRLWDVSQGSRTGSRAPAHVLATSGAHSLGAPSDSASSHHHYGDSEGLRPVWAATDVAFMDYPGRLVAITAAPLLPDAHHHHHYPASPPLSEGITSSGSTGSVQPLRRPASLSDLLYTGWGIHLFDTRTGDAPVALGARYPAFPGLTCALYDECSLTIVAGCEDGGLLLYDVRAGAVRARVPGVPLVALQQHSQSHHHRTTTVPSSGVGGLTGKTEAGGHHRLGSAESAASAPPDTGSLSPQAFGNDGGIGAPHSPSDSEASLGGGAQSTAAAGAHSFDHDDGCGPVPPRDLFGHAGAVRLLAPHPSRRLIASGGHDGEVRLWSLPDLAHSATVRGLHTALPRELATGAPHSSSAGARGAHTRHHLPPGSAAGGSAAPSSAASSHAHTAPVLHLDGLGPSSTAVLSLGVATTIATHAEEDPFPRGARHNPAASGGCPSNVWTLAAGVSGLVLSEDHLVSSGFDGSVAAVPQVW